MSLQRTLLTVERDLHAGRMNTARRRLHGLVDAYPYALHVREMLADVYQRLGNHVHEGRYRDLSVSSDPAHDHARAAFAARHDNDPVAMLRALDFRGHLDRIAGTHAAERLAALQRRAREEQGVEVTVGPRPAPARPGPEPPNVGWLLQLGCGLLVALVIALTLLGVNQVVGALFGR